jgi:hypothetical protein
VVAGIGWAGEAAPTIDQVAGQRLQLLHSDDGWRIFSITVTSGDTLPDHASGPRAILTLTDLEIRVLTGDAEPMSIEPWQAMWLTNTFSRGFENIGDDVLEYLVIEARDREIEVQEATRECRSGTPLLTNSALSICWIDTRDSETTIELDRPAWLYSEAPILTDRSEQHLAVEAGTHTLQASDAPVVIISFHPR